MRASAVAMRAVATKRSVSLLALFVFTACDTGVVYNPRGDGNPQAGADGSSSSSRDPSRNASDGATREDCPAVLRCGQGGHTCCAESEECVEGIMCLPICAHVRCGSDSALCCDADEICVDGVVCGRRCAAGETRCGSTLDTCCVAGDVCVYGTCTTPSQSCGDDFDCLGGERYCETTIGRCLQSNPDVDCALTPSFDTISLIQEWHFPGITLNGRLYENVMATPIVGDVSGDGMPDVVVPVYTADDTDDTVLVALSGDTGRVLFAADGVLSPTAEAPVALANFDDDPALEIVYRALGGGVRLLKGDGATELAFRNSGGGMDLRDAPAIADLDGDGQPDVVVGCHALNGLDLSDPARDFFDRGSCNFGFRVATVVANLDDDPAPEITSGGVAYNIDGTSLWEVTGNHGMVAIADLDRNGTPEVIVADEGTLLVRDGASGVIRIGPGGTWVDTEIAIPGGGSGGPPTVADFDADGQPEIATAGRAQYVVYDPDCLPLPRPRAGGDCTPQDPAVPFVRWTTDTQDFSSSITGSSVFDFQGDGAAEVVYNDECFLHIYNGTDGSEPLAEVIPNSSRTDFEYPLVVDVDRDGNSEIVVPANRDQAIERDRCDVAYRVALGLQDDEPLPAAIAKGTSGVYVFGDPTDRWVGTRSIWNQYSYHVTNVSEAGVVPAVEVDNFAVPSLNNYRQNVQGEAVLNAPNLAVSLMVATRCRQQRVLLSAEVSNTGSRGVPAGVEITFVRTDQAQTEIVGTSVTQRALLPGGAERATVVMQDAPEGREMTFEVHVDGDAADGGAIVECDETDNYDEGRGFCERLDVE